MTPETLDFGRRVLPDTTGLTVLEVGSRNVNGSYRGLIEPCVEYVGVDMVGGPGVDVLCDATNLDQAIGERQFDLVICTEMLEHAQHWAEVIHNLKVAVKPGGHLAVTTRSPGFPKHDYPGDWWRFTQDHMRDMFADFEILALESERNEPGVFMYARKPEDFVERPPTTEPDPAPQ